VPQGEWIIHDWGLSLGYALRIGMLRHYALSEEDIDFELEGEWAVKSGEISYRQASLAFIDPNLGGSGYLARIAGNFDRIAETTLQHLDHPNCQTACYRCVKSYRNQRHHEYLKWPGIVGDLEAVKAMHPPHYQAQYAVGGVSPFLTSRNRQAVFHADFWWDSTTCAKAGLHYPLPLDVSQAGGEEDEAERGEDYEIERERQVALAVESGMEGVGTVRQRQQIRERPEEHRQLLYRQKQPAQEDHGEAEEVGEGLRFEDFAHRYGDEQALERGRDRDQRNCGDHRRPGHA